MVSHDFRSFRQDSPVEIEIPESMIVPENFERYFGDLKEPASLKILKSSAEKMLETLDSRINNMETAIHLKNVDGIIFAAHQLKGSFNTMSSPFIANLCNIIECNAPMADSAFLKEHCDLIRVLSIQFSKELTQFLNTI